MKEKITWAIIGALTAGFIFALLYAVGIATGSFWLAGAFGLIVGAAGWAAVVIGPDMP